MEGSSLLCGEVGDGGVEVGEGLRGDAEAATGGGFEEGLVEDLAGVAGGAALEGVVERADDDGFPEVADGAFGLVRALEPGGEGFGVGGGIGAEEVEQAEGDAGLVGEREHGRAEEAERGVAGGREARSGAMSERRDGVVRVEGSRKVMVSYQRMCWLAPERLQRSTRLVQQPRRTCWESMTSSRAGWG